MLENAKNGFEVDTSEYQQLTQGDNSHMESSDDEEQDFRRSKKMKTSYQA
mgnify:CR=1 FL=1